MTKQIDHGGIQTVFFAGEIRYPRKVKLRTELGHPDIKIGNTELKCTNFSFHKVSHLST